MNDEKVRLGLKKRSKVALIAALVFSLAIPLGLYAFRDYFWGARADAREAVSRLEAGDLWALGDILEEKRGDADFAYFFTVDATPRALGDALGSVAGEGQDQLFKPGVNPERYELLLTDLGGTLSLATHGRDQRTLPESWAEEFILATTAPTDLYEGRKNFFDKDGKARERQDEANRANLLLLLSRGYWSTGFLQAVTAEYHAFDLRSQTKAWPDVEAGGLAKYAPAPGGVYLTDGIVALAAALTANPFAAEWAFLDFLPGNMDVEGTDYSVGRFTHFLMFEHTFATDSEGESHGATAVLTALSSAIDSFNWAGDVLSVRYGNPLADDIGPMHDAVVLEAIAQDLNVESGCSWHPRDYWNCAVFAADAVWQWAQRWGHLVLDILTFATFAPPPFNAIGVAAAATNASWFAIGGDFANAGLSLAAAVPGLAFAKIARAAKASSTAGPITRGSEKVARAARQTRASADPFEQRPTLRTTTKNEIQAAAPKTPSGNFKDPNTGDTIPKGGPFDYGHKPGYEHTCLVDYARRMGLSRAAFIDLYNKPDYYQIEDPSSNRSRKYQAAACAI